MQDGESSATVESKDKQEWRTRLPLTKIENKDIKKLSTDGMSKAHRISPGHEVNQGKTTRTEFTIHDKYFCTICGQEIHKKSFYRHLEVKHNFSKEQCLQTQMENKQQRATIQCPLCDEKVVDQEALANHCAKRHSEDGADGLAQDYTVFYKGI
ncbi:zinc finger, C2H2 type [Ostertagia ostertagi]